MVKIVERLEHGAPGIAAAKGTGIPTERRQVTEAIEEFEAARHQLRLALFALGKEEGRPLARWGEYSASRENSHLGWQQSPKSHTEREVRARASCRQTEAVWRVVRGEISTVVGVLLQNRRRRASVPVVTESLGIGRLPRHPLEPTS